MSDEICSCPHNKQDPRTYSVARIAVCHTTHSAYNKCHNSAHAPCHAILLSLIKANAMSSTVDLTKVATPRERQTSDNVWLSGFRGIPRLMGAVLACADARDTSCFCVALCCASMHACLWVMCGGVAQRGHCTRLHKHGRVSSPPRGGVVCFPCASVVVCVSRKAIVRSTHISRHALAY